MASLDQLKDALEELADESEEAVARIEMNQPGAVGDILKDIKVAYENAVRVWNSYSGS